MLSTLSLAGKRSFLIGLPKVPRRTFTADIKLTSQSSLPSRDLLWNKNVSIDEKMKFYRTFKTTQKNDILEMIDVCLLTTNSCSMMKREKEFKECLGDLKIFCSKLNKQPELKLNEKSWNFIIQHFCKDESFHSYAICLFQSNTKTKLARPNLFTLTAILKVCSMQHQVDLCEHIVNELEQQGAMNVFLYAHFINACIKENDLEKALHIVMDMKRKDIEPNYAVYIPLLKAATIDKNIKIGMELYQLVKKSNLSSPQLSMSIISLSLKLKRPELVIEEIQVVKEHNWMTCITWNCLIQAHIQMNQIKKAIGVIREMKTNDINPDSATFNILITACANSNLFEEGKLLHQLSIKTVKENSIELATSIVNFYTKCGHPDIAIQECEKMKLKGLMNVVSWNCLIQAHVQMNEIKKAIEIIHEMQKHGIEPNSITFNILITICANSHLFEEGKLIHTLAIATLKSYSVELATSIVNFYTKCGHPDIAIQECEKMKLKGLMNIVSWNCLIQAHIQMNEIKKAIEIIHEMQKHGIEPNSTTFTSLLTACANSNLFEEGKLLHQLSIKTVKDNSIELATSIVNFYTKCGHPDIAIQECEKLKKRRLMDTASWNCLIQAHVQMNEIKKAIEIIHEMQKHGIEPNSTTFTILLTACANSNLFEEGKLLHQLSIKTVKENSLELATSIVNFYTKCGHPDIAIQECEKMKLKGLMNIVSWNCLIQAHIQMNEIKKAIEIIHEMQKHGIEPNSTAFTILLTACANSNLFEEGKLLHQLCAISLNKTSAELTNSIINFYTKCGHPDIAIQECEKMKLKGLMNVVSWTCLIQAHIQRNEIKKAIETIHEMQKHGIEPNSTTFTILLTACANFNLFEEGKLLHQLSIKTVKENSIELATSIVNFYTKCGHPDIAIQECEKLKLKGLMNIVSWNCLIQAHVQMNKIKKAIETIHEMQKNGIEPNSTTFTILLTACANSNLFEEGKLLHELAVETLNENSIHLLTSIVNFYTKCGHPDIAIQECEKLKKRRLMDTASWNCLIQAHVQMNEIKKAIEIIREMQKHGIEPNSTTFTILLTACANSNLFEEGKLLHQLSIKTVKDNSLELATSIVNFYTKCGHPDIAIQDRILMDTDSRNCLIQAHIQTNEIKKAIEIIREMEKNGIGPNSTTFTILLTACANFNLFEEGKLLHQLSIKTVKENSIELATSIGNFYTKCGYPDIAIQEFETLKLKGLMNIVSWNCLIQAHIQMNEIKKAIEIISEMQKNGIEPNSTTFTILLTACANSNLFEEGKLLHELAIETLNENSIHLLTSIVNFYTKCGHPDIAIQECEKMKLKGLMNNVASWNCLIQAHIENTSTIVDPSNTEYGLNKAITVFNEMKESNFEPDKITYLILLSGCGEFVARGIGLNIIDEIKVKRMDVHEEIVSVMIYFYSRIANHLTAQELFENLVKKSSDNLLSIITYNNMLSCYAQHGNGTQARQLFNEMVAKKVELNDQTFTIMLNTFSHCGMVDEAIQLYDDMKSKFKHNGSMIIDCVMVDVFARAGRFNEAEGIINGRMNYALWSAIMGGCRKFNNIELGEKVFNILTSIDEEHAPPYILLSNIYMYHGLNEKAGDIGRLMVERGIKKKPGIVYHEEDGKVYQFISGTTKYDRFNEIEKMREEIYRKIIRAGFEADTRWVTSTKLLSEEEKIYSLCRHAEKTAIAHAFVLNPNRKSIILTKNLRVCNDCHTATEYISKVMNVEIIVRDANRYHHFKDGKCSCNGYW